MILEHLDESLILLRRKFYWDLHDIIYLKLFSSQTFFHRKSYKTEATPELIEQHKKWSPVDYALYEYFFKKLEKEIEKGGEYLHKEVQHFRNVNKKIAEFCHRSCDVFGQIKEQDLSASIAQEMLAYSLVIGSTPWQPQFEVTRQDCVDMLAQYFYQPAIQFSQWPQLCHSDSRQFCNATDMVGKFPLTKLKNSMYFNVAKCKQCIEM